MSAVIRTKRQVLHMEVVTIFLFFLLKSYRCRVEKGKIFETNVATYASCHICSVTDEEGMGNTRNRKVTLLFIAL